MERQVIPQNPRWNSYATSLESVSFHDRYGLPEAPTWLPLIIFCGVPSKIAFFNIVRPPAETICYRGYRRDHARYAGQGFSEYASSFGDLHCPPKWPYWTSFVICMFLCYFLLIYFISYLFVQIFPLIYDFLKWEYLNFWDTLYVVVTSYIKSNQIL